MKINSAWFFSDPHPLLRLFLIYVKGDAIVLLPFAVLIILTSLISLKFMLFVVGVYIAVRNFGEIIYWLLQQFGDRKYRPYDYGLKHLDNNAVYILYQTQCTAWVVVGLAVSCYSLLYL